ncbi:MAG: hypothetical protein JXA71_14875 [Chitinispirillaceae bacterium]|nr:hypothetical protein [Chitinispirillaceae bacterium]
MKNKSALTPVNRQRAEDTFDTTPQCGSRGSPQGKDDLTPGSDLFDFAPVGYFVLDEKGVTFTVNLPLSRHSG